MKDLANNIDVRRAISPVSVSNDTAQVSQIIDMLGYRSLTFAIAIGSIADADADFVVLIEHSDASDMSGSSAVPDVDLIGTEVAAGFRFDDDNETRKIGYTGSKRYVRLTITPTGNASAALLSALAILGHPTQLPVV